LPERIEALANSGGRRLAGRCARADDEVDRRQAVLSVPERFANYATKSVTGDCISDHSGAYGQTKAGTSATTRAHDERKTGISETASVPV